MWHILKFNQPLGDIPRVAMYSDQIRCQRFAVWKRHKVQECALILSGDVRDEGRQGLSIYIYLFIFFFFRAPCWRTWWDFFWLGFHGIFGTRCMGRSSKRRCSRGKRCPVGKMHTIAVWMEAGHSKVHIPVFKIKQSHLNSCFHRESAHYKLWFNPNIFQMVQ